MFDSNFSRSVLVLVGGTAISRAAMVLALPILTRLYTPEDFGVLGVFASVLTIVGVVSCLRFEIAIPIPTRIGDAASLLALGLLATAAIAALALLIVSILPQTIISATGMPELLDYLWLWPIGILLFGWYNGLQYWATRKKRFESIARTKAYQGIVGAVLQVGFGFLGVSPLGLLIGYVVSISAGVVSLGRAALSKDWKAIGLINVARMRQVALEYRRFPKYGSLEALVSGIGLQLPMILVAALAGASEAGFLFLVTRISGTPMGMIGASVGQVFLSKAPQENRSGTVDVLTLDVLGKLVKIGVGPLIFFAIVAEPVFLILFGEEWARAGQLVPWLTPWFILQFLSSPVSPLMQVMGMQKAMAALVSLGLVLRVVGVFIGFEISPSRVSEFLGLGSMVYYAILFLFVYRVAGLDCQTISRAFGRGLPILVSWVAIAVMIRAGLVSIS